MRPVLRDQRLAREFGERVRAFRYAAGMSQDALADKAQLHRSMIGHVERGEATPTIRTVVRLADALGIDPGKLVEGMRP